MRTSLFGCSAALVLAAICLSSAQETIPRKSSVSAGARSSEKGAVEKAAAEKAATKAGPRAAPRTADESGSRTSKGSPVEAGSAKADNSSQRSPEEEAIRETAESFLKAYAHADGKAAAAHFTSNAEYIDDEGNVFEGRDEIEKNFSRFFAENKGAQLEINIESIRVVHPGLAVEDGTTRIVRDDGTPLARSRYVAVHVKADGKWLVATVREHAPKGERPHREQLEQLAWLVGEWMDESDESIVTFVCRPVDDGNFLVRDFTVTVAGEEVLHGSQRIGWDPMTGRLRAWTFDSQGGHFEGVWHRDGDSWVLNSTGVTADGQTASGTSIFTLVDSRTITWQAVNHEVEGERKPDSELYTLVRRGPLPEMTADDSK